MATQNRGVLKRILKQLKGYKLWLAATVFFALVSVAGTLAVPVFFGQIVNLIVDEGEVYLTKIFEKFIIIAVCVAVTAGGPRGNKIFKKKKKFNLGQGIRGEGGGKI